MLAAMESKKKKKFGEMRKDENAGWCKVLKIWRPKSTVKADVAEKIKSRWFRDPNTDQWVCRDHVMAPPMEKREEIAA